MLELVVVLHQFGSIGSFSFLLWCRKTVKILLPPWPEVHTDVVHDVEGGAVAVAGD